MLKEIHEQPGAMRDTLVGRVDEHRRLLLDDLGSPTTSSERSTRSSSWRAAPRTTPGSWRSTRSSTGRGSPVEIDIASEFRFARPGPRSRHAHARRLPVGGDDRHARGRPARSPPGIQLARRHEHRRVVPRPRGGRRDLHARGAGDRRRVPRRSRPRWSPSTSWRCTSRRCAARCSRGDRGGPDEDGGSRDRWSARSGSTRRSRSSRRGSSARDWLFIGRHTGFPAALEGALKLKEISYVHAEGYPAGELKHGPIALVEDGVPVVAVATRCHVYPKMLSNIQECAPVAPR